jgi:hypothetical protein
MNKLKMVAGIFAVAVLSGCATTTTGPTPAGSDTYVVSRQEGAFPSGSEPLLAEALEIANTFCRERGNSMELINSREKPGPYIMGNYPKATVTFACR